MIARSTLITIRRVALVALLPMLFAVSQAHAIGGNPVGFQVSGGWYSEGEDVFAGAGLRVGLATITVIPNIEWLFVDNGKAYAVNIDGTLDVLPLGVATGYVGGGIGWFIVDPDNFDSESETIYNLIAGASFNLTSLKPFGQVKWVVRDGDDPMVLSIGLHF